MLRWTCGVYRYRYGEWPQRLEITSRTLWSLAVQFGRENLGRLAERLEIRTIPESPDGVYPAESLTVSGEAGSLRFADAGGDKLTNRDEGLAYRAFIDEAASWLGLDSLEATGGRVVKPGSESSSSVRTIRPVGQQALVLSRLDGLTDVPPERRLRIRYPVGELVATLLDRLLQSQRSSELSQPPSRAPATRLNTCAKERRQSFLRSRAAAVASSWRMLTSSSAAKHSSMCRSNALLTNRRPRAG